MKSRPACFVTDFDYLTRNTWSCYKSSRNLINYDQWKEGSIDKFGVEASPLSLFLLGALRYLGRGWTFDDIEEATAMNAETIGQFFHKSVKYGSTAFYQKHVATPTTTVDAEAHICDFRKAGFPGCVSSTDTTHIALDNCSCCLKHLHKGFKKFSSIEDLQYFCEPS